MNHNKIILISSLIILLAGVCIYWVGIYSLQPNRVQDKDVVPGQISELTDAEIIEKAGRHILLPVERPKVVKLKGVLELKKEQKFLADAQEGDIMLIFSNKVIIYNPSIDKLIEVAYIRKSSDPDYGEKKLYQSSESGEID